MEVAETVFSAIFNVLSIYIGFRIISLFLHKKEVKETVSFAIYFGVWLINWGAYYILNQVYLTMASLVIGMLIATFILYEGSIFRKVVAVGVAVTLGMVFENIVWILFGKTIAFQRNAAFGSMVSSFFMMVAVLILERVFQFEKKDKISKGSYINLIIILIGSGMLGEILVQLAGEEQSLAMVGLSGICFINVSTLYLYDKINEVYSEKLERKASEQKALMYENQLNIMEQSEKKIRSMQHDMKNHLLLLNTFVENQEYLEALAYIKNLNQNMEVSGQYVKTGNQEIDAILNYAFDRAEKMSCRIEKKIEIPDGFFMPKLDLNVVLSNLLDNAIEAIQKAKKKYLYVGLKYEKGIFVIRVYNSYDGTIIKSGEKLLTRKADKLQHGLGMQNVSEIIEKYNGEQIIRTTDALFQIDIILYTK